MTELIEENDSKNLKYITVKFDTCENSTSNSIVLIVPPGHKLCKMDNNFYVKSNKDDSIFEMSVDDIFKHREELLFKLKTIQRMCMRIDEIGKLKMRFSAKYYSKETAFQLIFTDKYINSFNNIDTKLYNILLKEKNNRNLQETINILAKNLHKKLRIANLNLSNLENKLFYI